MLLHRLKAEAGIDLRVVSGQEEARLIYLGVASGMEIGDHLTFFIDIGGGSTETIVGNQNDHFYLHSHKLGAIRLSNLFLGDSRSSLSSREYETVRAYIRRSAASTLRELADFPIDQAVGSSGTIESLADVASRMKDSSSEPGRLTYRDLQAAIRMLCSLSLEERRLVPGSDAGPRRHHHRRRGDPRRVHGGAWAA